MTHFLTPEVLKQIADAHVAIFGKTRVGKSKLLELMALTIARDPLSGFTFICPHGTAREVAQRLSNPTNGCHHRTVHVLDPSADRVFGASPFECHDPTNFAACHDASILWTSSVASSYGTAMQQTPRLETNFYVLGMFAAHKNLTLVELLPALSLGGEAIREFLLSNFNNHAVASVLADLHELAARSPARYLEQIDSCKNRLVRWLGDKRLERIFGQRKGLDARAVMDNCDIVCIDLSSLAAEDAAFLSIILTCRYFAAAKRRPPNTSPRHRLIIDEAGSGSLCNATALMLSEAAKFGLLATFSLQHLGQLLDKGDLVTRSMMVNTGCKIVFNTPDAESARVLAEQIHTGHLDLEAWKPASVRPVAVGNHKVIVRGRTCAEHHATSRSRAKIDAASEARASAAMSATMLSSGFGFGSGQSTSFASLPPDGLLSSTALTGVNRGRNSNLVSSNARGTSSGVSSSRQFARSHARADARAETEGTTDGESETEAYITNYQDMPTQMFTLEEQLHTVTGQIMTLPARTCWVKTENRPPFVARTPDIPTPFKSTEFRDEWWPRYLERVTRSSPYLVPGDQVDTEIAARLERISAGRTQEETDFAEPERAPIVESLERARETFKASRPPSPDDEPPARGTPHLRVLDGGKDGDNS